MQRVIKDIQVCAEKHFPHLADNFVNWVVSGIECDGPWNTRLDARAKVNSFLLYRLAKIGPTTTKLRRYLDLTDSYELWIQSVCIHILPRLQEEFDDEC